MERNKWVNSSQEKLIEFAKDFQSSIIEALKDFNLDTDNGKIRFNKKNFASISNLEALLKKSTDLHGEKLINWFLEAIQENSKLQQAYFGDKSIPALDNVLRLVLFSLGYDGDKFLANGFFRSLAGIDEPIRKIKAETIKAISSGKTFNEFSKGINKFVGDGLVERHIRTIAYDTFAQVDRQIHIQTARSLGMKYFLYSKGLQDTSRQFCIDRVGEVFTEDEIEDWKNLEWQGKPKSGYDPFTDVGGHNCSHLLNAIGEAEAIRRRPDLAKK